MFFLIASYVPGEEVESVERSAAVLVTQVPVSANASGIIIGTANARIPIQNTHEEAKEISCANIMGGVVIGVMIIGFTTACILAFVK